MGMSVSLEELISRPYTTRPAEKASPERAKEKQKRLMEYRRLALQGLAKMHPHDYSMLYEQAKVIVDNKRGPLPD